jgi:hypothetical protein
MSIPADDVAELLREEITAEVRQMLGELTPADLEVYEMAGMVSILRGAKARMNAAEVDPPFVAPVLELVRERKAR